MSASNNITSESIETRVIKQSIKFYRQKEDNVKYVMPQSEKLEEREPYERRGKNLKEYSDPGLPQRLNVPLVPLPDELENYLTGEMDEWPVTVSPLMKSGSIYARKSFKKIIETYNLSKRQPFEELMIRFKEYSFSFDHRATGKEFIRISEKMAMSELRQAAQTDIGNKKKIIERCKINDSLQFIDRLRAKLSSRNLLPFSLEALSTDETSKPEIMSMRNGPYFVYDYRDNKGFCLLNTGYFILLADLKSKIYSVAPSDFANFFYSFLEITNNCQILRCCEDYKEYWPMLDYIYDLDTLQLDYKSRVAIMKNLETLLIMRVDVESKGRVVWYPIFSALSDVFSIFCNRDPTEIELEGMSRIFINKSHNVELDQNLVCLLKLIANYSGLSALELSSIHKYYMYSIVSEKEGLDKYIKRTCTKREIDNNYTDNLLYSFRRMFITGFVKKHGVLPDLETTPIKKANLISKVNYKNPKLISELPIEFFKDVKILKSIDGAVPMDKLHYAKDKMAYSPGNAYGSSNTVNEIEATITDKGEMNQCSLRFFNKVDSNPRVRISKVNDFRSEEQFIVKLAGKEREQKQEQRLFGIATLDLKVGLSIITEQSKKVLSYINGNLMTPSNKERNELLHNMSQKTMREEVWSFLADIEGHNQSMQYENTHKLAEEIAMITGIENLASLPNIFRSLEVFYVNKFLDEVTIVNNQYGGIEGWANPFWTIVTCAIFDSSRDKSPLPIDDVAIYSDDVNLLAILDQFSLEKINEFFHYQIDHASKLGFKLKLSQTVFSKNRITMLRRHYCNGRKADSTLKKLLSVSSMNEPSFTNDATEAQAVSASINSALEQSNHPFPCLFMKHMHIVQLCYRSFTHLICHPREDSMIPYERLTPVIQAVISQNAGKWLKVNAGALKRETSNFLYSIKARMEMTKEKDIEDIIKNFIRSKSDEAISLIKIQSPEWLIMSNIFNDKYLTGLYIMLNYVPESWGGLGVTPFIYQAMSGHSVSISRTFDFIINLLHLLYKDTRMTNYLINNVCGINKDMISRMPESSILTSYYPSGKNITTLESLAKYKILGYMKSLELNAEFKKIIKLDEERSRIKIKVMNYLRSGFHTRISAMFLEHSPLKLIDGLVNKVETSRGFFRRSGNMGDFRRKVYKNNRENYLKLFRKCEDNLIDYSTYGSITEFLEIRKVMSFPNVQFISMPEPVFESVIDWTDPSKTMITATKCPDTDFKLGFEAYRFPDIASDSLYKGEKANRYIKFEGSHSKEIYDLSNYVRWIIETSGHDANSFKVLLRLNIYQCFCYILSLYDINNHEDIFRISISNAGGNIAHRLTGNLFRSDTDLHIYPNFLGSISSTVRPDIISELNLNDSNINFDLLIKRVKLAFAVRHQELNVDSSSLSVGILTYIDVKDVRIDWCRLLEIEDMNSDEALISYQMPRLDLTRMEILSQISIVEKTTPDSIMITTKELELIDRNYPNRIRILRILQYREQLISNGLIMPNEAGTIDKWRAFMKKEFGHRVIEFTIDEEIEYESILDVLSEYPTIMSAYFTAKSDIDFSSRIGESLLQIMSNENERFQTRIDFINKLREGQMKDSRLMSIMQSYIKVSTTSLSVRKETMIFVEEILIILICKNFPSFNTDGISININVSSIINQMNDCMKLDLNLENTFTSYIKSSYLLNFMFPNGEIEPIIRKICNNLYDWLSDVNLMQLIRLPDDKTGNHKVDVSLEDIDIEEDYKYSINQIQSLGNDFSERLHRIIVQVDITSKVYADIKSLSSPTGSDSYVSQYGLFNMLKSEVNELEKFKIGDLCAGRGDGRLAITRLNLDCISYSKKDIFTSMYSSAPVIIINDYDITNIENISLYSQFDILHFDISFPKGNWNDFFNLVKSDQFLDKLIILRINSIDTNLLTESISNLLIKRRCFLSYPKTGRIMPYQIYLLIEPIEILDKNSKPFIVNSHLETLNESYSILKDIQSNYSNIVNWSNFTHPGDDKSLNSTISVLEKLPPLEDVLRGDLYITDLLSKCVEVSILRELDPMFHLIPIPIDMEELSLKYNSIGNTLDKEFSERIIKIYNSYEKDKGSKPKSEESFSKRRDKYSLRFKEFKFVRITDIELDDLDIIKYKHPYRLARKLSVAISVIYSFSENIDRLELVNIVESLLVSKTSKIKMNSKRGNQIMQTLEYLAYGLIKNDQFIPYTLAMKSFLVKTSRYKDNLQILIDMRRLSNKIQTWNLKGITNMAKSRFIDKFQKKFGSFLNKPLIKKMYNAGDMIVNYLSNDDKDLNEDITSLITYFESGVMASLLGVSSFADDIIESQNLIGTVKSDSINKFSFNSDSLSKSLNLDLQSLFNKGFKEIINLEELGLDLPEKDLSWTEKIKSLEPTDENTTSDKVAFDWGDETSEAGSDEYKF
jgi:hypothetical protein